MLMHELDEAGDEEGRRENEHLDLPSSRSPRRAESEMRTAAETVALSLAAKAFAVEQRIPPQVRRFLHYTE